MFCPHCGAPASTGSKFCPKCGTQLEGVTPLASPPPSQAVAPAGVSEDDHPYAGFWRRFGGWVIDYFVAVVLFVLVDVIPMRLLPATPRGALGIWALLSYLAVPWLYFAGMESSALQA